MSFINYSKSTFYLLLSVCIPAVLFIAFYNGYPVVEGDTGSYILHGFRPVLPADRSVFYCLFVRLASLGLSLWLVILFQAVIISYLLLEYLTLFTPGRISFATGVIAITAIITGCPVSWVTCFVMPDIFTAILALAALLFLYHRQGAQSKMGLLLFIIIAATLVHNSHFLILFLFSSGVVLYALIAGKKLLRFRGFSLMLATLFCWLLVCTMHLVRGQGFIFSKGSNIFLTARFSEDGILKKYLDAECRTKANRFCAYKEDLPKVAWEFLWDETNSPLYKAGGWDSCREACGQIVHHVFMTPEYRTMFIHDAMRGSALQLGNLGIGGQQHALDAGSAASKAIDVYFAKEAPYYRSSKQNRGLLNTVLLSGWYVLFFIVSSVMALVVLVLRTERTMCEIYFLLLLFIVANAVVTATFANVLPRLEYRVAWVLPATNIMLLVRFFWSRSHRKYS